MEKLYILNPDYFLVHEKTRSLLLMKSNYSRSQTIHILHPISAMFLSIFNGISIKDSITKIKLLLNIDEKRIKENILPLIENNERVKLQGTIFPEKTIVEFNENMAKHEYRPEDFIYDEIDLSQRRLLSPSDIICNITMKCLVLCEYCYAHQTRIDNINKIMPIEKLLRIIDEAKEIGVVNFKIIGGDVFMYQEWEKLLEKLKENGYNPCIGTKVPLNEEQVIKLKKFINKNEPIQISLDTLIPENLSKILNVSENYYEKIRNTFELFEKHKIYYIINSVVSSYNDSLDDMKSLVSFFSDKRYFIGWAFNSAKYSMHNKKFLDYKPSKKNVMLIQEYFKEINEKKIFNFSITPPPIVVSPNDISIERKKQIFKHDRDVCSGNFNSIYILPDGKVTICEELYWTPKFIIGDLMKNSIVEVWNSEKALSLYNLSQSNISPKSVCSKCNAYDDCRKVKHVCWRDVVLYYGKENWDFPDAYCYLAPKIDADISII